MSIADWYQELPIVTRVYVTLCFLTTAGCALDLVSPMSMYFNARLVLQKLELWRLVTNFLFFGSLGLDFVFHMLYLVRYSKALEEGSFRGRSADFLWMLLFGGSLLTVAAPFCNVHFLSFSLTFMMVYVWARRNQHVQLNFLGVFTFRAPYLPWVLLGFSVVLRSSPVVDLLGICAGHCYYFLADVYPGMTGRRPLATPALLLALFPEGAAIGPLAGTQLNIVRDTGARQGEGGRAALEGAGPGVGAGAGEEDPPGGGPQGAAGRAAEEEEERRAELDVR